MRTIQSSQNFNSSIKTVGATVLGGLWALDWARHTDEINLRWAGISQICMPKPSVAAYGKTDRLTEGHGQIG